MVIHQLLFTTWQFTLSYCHNYGECDGTKGSYGVEDEQLTASSTRRKEEDMIQKLGMPHHEGYALQKP